MERRGSEKEVNEKEDNGWSGQFPVVVRMPLSGQPLRNPARVLPDGETAPSRGSFSYWRGSSSPVAFSLPRIHLPFQQLRGII